MAKSRDTFRKKELEDKKEKKRKKKEEKKEARRSESKSGSLDDMMAYVDEFGRISSTPPDPSKKQEISSEEIQVGVPKQLPPNPADLLHTGTVSFFNSSKGYGFIKDAATQESVFVHMNGLTMPVVENDRVSFEIEKGPRGYVAVNVSKIG